MTRVAYVCADHGVPVFGDKGCSVHVREMCRTMREHGCDVTLFATRRGGEPTVDMRDTPVIDLPGSWSATAETRELESIAGNERVMRALETSGSFDVIYERASLWSVAPMVYARRTGAAGILELNAPLVDEQARYRSLTHTTVARALLIESLRAAHLVVAVSDAVAAWARTLLGDVGHVHVLPNGVDPRRFDVRCHRSADRGGGNDPFVIGFVGTLKPWHGLETLIDAFQQLVDAVPSAQLLIVGDGPERRRIETRVIEAGLMDRATFAGAVAHDGVPALLAKMDVAVAPYPPLDGFYFSPLKLTEYMAAGLPVVASAIGQITALVRHEVTGLLFPPGESAALAIALRRLHADAPLCDRLGRAARQFVAEHHTWQRALERIFVLADVSSLPVDGNRVVAAGADAPFDLVPLAQGKQ